MRNSQITRATDLFRGALPETVRPHEPRRWFAYVEAVAACGLLVLVGVTLFTPWN
ncbi:MAG TPA: hypothetical protein VLG14_13735 [Sphingomonas sp.]|jgi:hypothetical protein|nr:hypothetical protein [Sphingomonas sp.]